MAQVLGKGKAITKELELEQGFKLLAENYADISEGEAKLIHLQLLLFIFLMLITNLNILYNWCGVWSSMP